MEFKKNNYDRIAYIPRLPSSIDYLFFPHYGSVPRPNWNILEGNKVEFGQPICGYSASWLFSSSQASIFSPVNGILVSNRGRFTSTDEYGFPLPASENNYMFSVLLLDYEIIPINVSICFSKICDFTWKYRKKLF